MPATVGKSKKEIFGILKERIWARINGWGEKLLSGAGREVMIKSVLQAIPSYIMGCFLLPKNISNLLEQAIRSYWWSGGRGTKLAWVSWNKLCLPKSKGGLGFRNMQAFNIALLAKQGWRLLQYPDSLLGQIYKARYYPLGSFHSAALGNRPSATWRSIWSARRYLAKGLRFRVGNGQGISIWADPWIPEDGNFRVISPKPFHSGFPYAVADLIGPITRTWNLELIDQHLWEIDKTRILTIPIGSVDSPDRLIWHFSKTGKFTVNSCYHMICSEFLEEGKRQEHGGDQVGGSGSTQINWNLIWRLKVPPKVCMFLWRATLDILPHNAALCQRKVPISPFCSRCSKVEETTVHALFGCDYMRKVWAAPPFSLALPEDRESFWARLMRLKKSLDEVNFLLAVIVMWKAWEVRNREAHESDFQPPEDIVQWSANYLDYYHSAQLVSRPLCEDSNHAEWSPPPHGIIKINVDAGLPGNIRDCWVAMVARNQLGACVWWSKKQIVGRPSPTDSEALAILHGLKTATNQGWRRIILQSDCLQLIQLLSQGTRSLASFGAVLDSCYALFSFFETISFVFIRRSGNMLAYRLATYCEVPCMEGSTLPLDTLGN